MIFVLNKTNTIANEFLLQLRDRQIQSDRMRFRKNMERLGEIMAYELSKSLSYQEGITETVLGDVKINRIHPQPVLIPILRAALPFYQGFLNYFDEADSGFIGAYRLEGGDSEIRVNMEYQALGSVDGKRVILIDPMLATGTSLLKVIEGLRKKGKPKHIDIVSVIAAPEGIDRLKKKLGMEFNIWTCAIDEKLDENSFIVPGLGDAGDLSYGVKD